MIRNRDNGKKADQPGPRAGSGEQEPGRILRPKAGIPDRITHELGRLTAGEDPAVAAEVKRIAAAELDAQNKLARAIVELARFRATGEPTTLISVDDKPDVGDLLAAIRGKAEVTAMTRIDGTVTTPKGTGAKLGLGDNDTLPAQVYTADMPKGGALQQLHFTLVRTTQGVSVDSPQVMIIASPDNTNIVPASS